MNRWKSRAISGGGIIAVLPMFAAGAVCAQQTNEELAKTAQYPLASTISPPFENHIDSDYGPNTDPTQNRLNIQPVIPVTGGRFITPKIVPSFWQPQFTLSGGTRSETCWTRRTTQLEKRGAL